MPSTITFQRLGMIFRTAKHLLPSQWWWRAQYTVERQLQMTRRRAGRWRWHGLQLPRIRANFPEMPTIDSESNEAPETPVRLREGIFRHLHSSHVVGYDRPDWRLGPVAQDRLWTITLHYHKWAYALADRASTEGPEADEAAALFRHYVSDWIAHCSLEAAGARSLAWNAFAIATRVGWWIRSYQKLGARWTAWRTFQSEFLHSLWQQAAYLRDHLEWDLLANHILRDAVGLAWAGRFFQEEQAKRWLATATQLAHGQLREQLLPDGGHFERSPMYHLQVMGDIGSLAILLEDATVRAAAVDAWRRMAEYSAWMRHPDGQVPLFNDSAIDAEHSSSETTHWASHLGLEIDTRPRRGGYFFSDSGVAIWQGNTWTVFFDVGRLGPDYQPGHAHADTLSLECSYCGSRVFVDPGVFGYDRDERRQYDRSTEAHNTVCIDEQDSSEVWDIFRVGRRANTRDVDVDFSDHGMTAAASHTGYGHLPGRPRHIRTISVSDNGAVIILDRVEGSGRHIIQGGFLLSSDWVAILEDDGWTLTNGPHKLKVHVQATGAIMLGLNRRPYHPQFGLEIETFRLSWESCCEIPIEVRVHVEQA